jgi:hypothetical protein
MPTLQIKIRNADEQVSLIHDIGAQEMRLRQVAVQWGVQVTETGEPDTGILSGCLVDLSQMGASTSEIVGYTPNRGSTANLYIPRPNCTYFNNGGGAGSPQTINPIQTFFIMTPNLSFHSGDVYRNFSIRTYEDNALGLPQSFAPDQLREITLYFDYETNDINR